MTIQLSIRGEEFIDLFEWMDNNYPEWRCTNSGYVGDWKTQLLDLGDRNPNYNFSIVCYLPNFRETDRVAMTLMWNVLDFID